MFEKPDEWTEAEFNFMIATNIIGRYGCGIGESTFNSYKALAEKLNPECRNYWLPEQTVLEKRRAREVKHFFESLVKVTNGKGIWDHLVIATDKGPLTEKLFRDTITAIDGMREFEIWMEGYRATGESGEAQLIGKAMGKTLEDACRNFREPEDIVNPYGGEIIRHKGDVLKFDMHNGYPTIWGCKLYDNEQDARKSFG